MEIIQTNIPGVLIIEPRVFKDSRGYFFERFSQREFDENQRTSNILLTLINIRYEQ